MTLKVQGTLVLVLLEETSPKDLALTAITTLFWPGTLSDSLLELEGIAANCIEFGSANDETIFTVCGSPTVFL